jgi:hypothetical protein
MRWECMHGMGMGGVSMQRECVLGMGDAGGVCMRWECMHGTGMGWCVHAWDGNLCMVWEWGGVCMGRECMHGMRIRGVCMG